MLRRPVTRRRRRSRWRLVDALENGRIEEGDLLLLVGFGAGMTAPAPCCAGAGSPHEPCRPRDGRVARHRAGLCPALRRPRRQGRGHLPLLAAADDVFGVPCDVTSGESVEAAFAAVEEQYGPVEVLVSNAGVTNDGLLLRMSEDDHVGDRRQPHRRTRRQARQGMRPARVG